MSGIAGIAFSAVSTIVGAIGQIQSSKAAASRARFQQAIAARNAKVARQAAVRELELGEIEKQDVETQARLTIAQQQATLAASGVDVTQGSAIDLKSGTADLFQEDALMALANAQQRAFNREEQAIEFDQEGVLRGRAASNARTAGLFAAGGTLLSGASSVAAKWKALS